MYFLASVQTAGVKREVQEVVNVLVKWSVFVRTVHVTSRLHPRFLPQPAQAHVHLLCMVIFVCAMCGSVGFCPTRPHSPSPLFLTLVLFQLKQVYQYYSALGTSETDDIFTISLEQVRYMYSP
jgi:hypothetical protein